MPNMVLLRQEITTDPLVRGYGGMSNTQILTSLKTVNRAVNVDLIETYKIKKAIPLADWRAIAAADRDYIAMITSTETIDNQPGNIRDAFTAIFVGRTAALNALSALITRPVNRLEEQGIGQDVTEGDIAAAKSGNW